MIIPKKLLRPRTLIKRRQLINPLPFTGKAAVTPTQRVLLNDMDPQLELIENTGNGFVDVYRVIKSSGLDTGNDQLQHQIRLPRTLDCDVVTYLKKRDLWRTFGTQKRASHLVMESMDNQFKREDDAREKQVAEIVEHTSRMLHKFWNRDVKHGVFKEASKV